MPFCSVYAQMLETTVYFQLQSKKPKHASESSEISQILSVKQHRVIAPPRKSRINPSHSHECDGRLAQLVEHLVYTERVSGSNPLPPTIPFKSLLSRITARLPLLLSNLAMVCLVNVYENYSQKHLQPIRKKDS